MNQTKLKAFMQPLALPNFASLMLLILRLIVGIAFVLHGWGKIQAPMSWMPAGGPVAVPGFLQMLAAVSEFGGGIALILGALTSVAMLGLACTMVVAVYFHAVVMKDPFVNMTGGSSYEPALGYLGISLLILALGAGKYSVDAKVFGERKI